MEKPTKIEVGQRWRWGDHGPAHEVTAVFEQGACRRHAYEDSGCGHFDGDTWAPLYSFAATGTFHGWAKGCGPQPPATAEKCDCYYWATCTSAPHQCGACGKMCPGRKQSTIVVNAPVPQVAAAQETVTPSGYARIGDLTALEAIRSRKPPEPWRPTVDDWDLLPDA